MENVPLPSRIEFKKDEGENHSILTVEPCFPGYGTTLGNALRRVLLSSLPGAAITSFKVKGADHEFSSLPDIKEDLVEIILNLKKLRFKLHEPSVKLHLDIKGEKKVTAKDIEPNSAVEVITTDLPIATITNPKGELVMELTVKRGHGYESTEERSKEDRDSLAVGEISIDALYTPVKNVGFNIEDVRVGQITNYERLALDIKTDGTITPAQALGGSIEILLEHFNLLRGFGDKMPEVAEPEEELAVVSEAKEEISNNDAGEIAESAEEKPKKKRGRPKKE